MQYLKTLITWLQNLNPKADRYEECPMSSVNSLVALHRKLGPRRWKIDGSVDPESLEYVYSWVRR